ncbi:RHS-repeat-containing protein [Lysobacter dokdonensis DS-58]|uniref:RHS-repeat-containing protein n=1 Tax=Lysobacter dokdonensis DS-58 TaxID=1300345 RepID=A0A0A2WJ49_9GAMM|nr:RHS-repeat-containing protein [Lysobacter dokdonensis DS-58]
MPGYAWSNDVGYGFSGERGSEGEASTPTAPEQETDDKRDQQCDETRGNPVVLYTGNKVESELDFAAGGEMPLHLSRTYNRMWTGIGLFGKHWLSNFDYTLVVQGAVAWAQRPDGHRLKFVSNTDTQRWVPAQPGGVAYVVRNGDGSHTLHNDEGGTETYDTEGYIRERRNAQGIAWTFAYSAKRLQSVTHTSGRKVTFTWSSGQLTEVTDPAGSPYRYTYAPNVFGTGRGRLASASAPGAPTTIVEYHYEDARFAGALTGKSFDGVRFSTFAYDAQGRAISTEHAGGVERYTFEYHVDANEALPLPPATPPPGGFMTDAEKGWECYQHHCIQPYAGEAMQPRPIGFRVVETNPLGRKTTHTYEDGRKVSVAGHVSANCTASYRDLTYDANGFPDIFSDFTDTLTDFDHDAQGRLVKSVEAAGTPLARTTLREWNATMNRLMRITRVGELDTQFEWTGDGRPAVVTTRNLSPHGVPLETRTTTYRYIRHPNGLLASATADGPLLNDEVTSTFNAQGDLVRVENGVGHATTYANHDALGQPGRVTGPNGDVTDYTYDARGRVVSATRIVAGVPQITHYTFHASGLPASVRTPDGRELRWIHDAARRTTEEYEREPDGRYARKVTRFNAMSQPTKVDILRTAYPAQTTIQGHVEGVVADGAAREVHGWACTTGQDAPINVDLYVGGAWPTGTFLGRHPANKASEPAVASACQAQGAAYRLQIALTDAQRDAHGGKSIHVHGLSPAGKSNDVLGGSGAHLVPRLVPAVAPASLSAPAQSTTGAYTVYWASTVRATFYRLEERTSAGAWTLVHDAAATSRAVTGKTAGTYRYRVAACNESGCGPWSPEANVVDIDPPSDVPAASVPAVNTTGAFTVSWNAVEGATSYHLDESTNGGAWTQVQDAAVTSRAVTGKSTAVPHAYRVRACNAAGCGGHSATRTIAQIVHDAQIVLHDVPGHVFAQEQGTVRVTVKNTGNAAWPAGSVYLGRTSAAQQTPVRTALPAAVAPGGSATIQYTFVAPSGPVSPPVVLRFGGRMHADGVGPFGATVPEAYLEVENPDGFCSPGSGVCQEPRRLPKETP